MGRKRSTRRKHALSHSHWKLGSLTSLTAIVSAVVGSMLFTSLSTGTAVAAPLAADLGLPANHSCGTETATFRVIEGAPQHTVFKLNDVWHKANPCLKDLRDLLRNQPATAPIHNFVYYQLLYLLSRQPVQFSDAAGIKVWTIKNLINTQENLDLSKLKRIIYLSSAGSAYDGMGQSDLAVWGLDVYSIMAAKTGANPDYTAAYKAVGVASMETITALTNNKGLRSTRTCALNTAYKCSWFHSRTKDDGVAEDGMTLNKHLQIVRDLWDFAQDLRSTGNADLVSYAEKYEAAALEGTHQLVYAASYKKTNVSPNLFDFVARKPNGEAIKRSWFFYSFSPAGSGYFLKENTYKNCVYHERDITLLAGIFERLGHLVNKKGFNTKPADGSLGNKTILDYLVEAYEIKQADGLYVDSTTSEGGNFKACDPANPPVDAAALTFLRSF